MMPVLMAFGSYGAALLVHVVVWRIRVPTAIGPAFIFLFGGAYLVAAGVYVLSVPDATAGGALYASVLYWAFAACYAMTYIGVVSDSPMLTLVQRMAESGAEGITDEELQDFIRKRPFVRSRLAQLYRKGWVRKRGDRLELSEGSARLLRTYDLCRRILGRRPGAG